MSYTDKEMIDALREAGVHKAFQRPDRSITDYVAEKEAADLRAWAKGFTATKTPAHGLCLVGTRPAYDAAMMTARSLLAQEVETRVTNLMDFAKEVDSGDNVEIYEDMRAIVLLGLYDSGLPTPPLSSELLNAVQFALARYIDNGMTMIFTSTQAPSLMKWWSRFMVETIKNFKVVVIQ